MCSTAKEQNREETIYFFFKEILIIRKRPPFSESQRISAVCGHGLVARVTVKHAFSTSLFFFIFCFSTPSFMMSGISENSEMHFLSLLIYLPSKKKIKGQRRESNIK
jgi:hypothetical protein